MKTRRRVGILLAALGLAIGALVLVLAQREPPMGPLPPADPENPVRLEPRVTGLEQPTDLTFVPGVSARAIVLQKAGRALLVEVGGPEPFVAARAPVVLDLEVRTAIEMGLLGLAFHPRFAENGRIFVDWNPADGQPRTRISEWRMSPAALEQPARDERVILEVDQPYANHNAGQLAFGPDGMLYVGLGDGGSGGDPDGHAQNLGTLLGSMLRIDVDRADPGLAYAIPPDNPFFATPGARPEIWAYGLRNPWRYTFDPAGRLIVADVGQDAWEEIDLVEPGDNLGWNVREGNHCFATPSGCTDQGLVAPIHEYGHDVGNSVTGGHVYLGRRLPALSGKYVFADFVTGRLWALTLPPVGSPRAAVAVEPLGRHAHMISSFGRDAAGELYALDFAGGKVLALVPP